LDVWISTAVEEVPLSFVLGSLSTFATNELGSRFIQAKLKDASLEELETLVKEAILHMAELAQNCYGNHVLQSILRDVDSLQQQRIVDMILWHGMAVPWTTHRYGCRVMQAVFDVATPSQRTELALLLRTEHSVKSMLKDPSASLVVQRLVDVLSPLEADFILDSTYNHACELVLDKFASEVLLKLFLRGPLQCMQPLLDELAPHWPKLAPLRNGSRIACFVAESGSHSDRAVLINSLRGHFLKLSMHKDASSVVEACLKFGTDDQRCCIISDVLDAQPVSLDNVLRSGKEKQQEMQLLWCAVQPHLVSSSAPLEAASVPPFIALTMHPAGSNIAELMLVHGGDLQGPLEAEIKRFGAVFAPLKLHRVCT